MYIERETSQGCSIVPAKAGFVGFLWEENYTEMMEKAVEPYLKKRCRDAWIPRVREGAGSRRILHVQQYLAEKPRGVVVICHGFTEYAQKYQETIFYFLRNHYHVYIPEHCGHGCSYRLTEDPSLVHIDHWGRYVQDFLRVSRLVKKKHPKLAMYLYAHSMGGAIGTIAAAREPQLFDKIVLSSPMIRPRTGGVPWRTAVAVARSACAAGRGENYVAGQKPYSGKENFETSSGRSLARFERYCRFRREDQRLQNSAASYSWLYQAAGMSRYLLKKAWQELEAPVLLLQAETDSLVSLKAQDVFCKRINHLGKSTCILIRIPGTRHDLSCSLDEEAQGYWGEVFGFLNKYPSKTYPIQKGDRYGKTQSPRVKK